MDGLNRSESAARLLMESRQTGRGLTAFPEIFRPRNIEDALAIQDSISRIIGGEIGGWKCGTPEADKILLAPISASRIARGPVCPIRSHGSVALAEPEIAYVLGRDLPGRDRDYSREEVMAAVRETRLALEIIGTSFSDPENQAFPELLADNLSNEGLFVGPAIPGDWGSVPASFEIVVADGDQTVLVREGRHRDGDASLPLCWLANFLARRGRGLRAGQTVITGSYAGLLDLPLRRNLTIRFGGLGKICVEFQKLVQTGE